MNKKLGALSLCLVLSVIVMAQQDSGMVLVPGGEFLMGNNMNNGLGFSPAHKVKVDSFYMDVYEVRIKTI